MRIFQIQEFEPGGEQGFLLFRTIAVEFTPGNFSIYSDRLEFTRHQKLYCEVIANAYRAIGLDVHSFEV